MSQNKKDASADTPPQTQAAAKQKQPQPGKPKAHAGPEARVAKGFRDIEAGELTALNGMLQTIRGVYERYGFDALETPALEYTDALGKFLPCLLYTSPSPRDRTRSRMPSSA